VPRVKKTADMTYHDFLIKALTARPALEAPTKKQSYRLHEDLELLLDLSAYTEINSKCFEDIATKKKINRTLESLKSRYHDYLAKIGEAEMKKIVTWVEKEGVEGYLSFEEDDLKISLSDPSERRLEPKKEEKKEDKKRSRAASLEASEKKFDKKKESKEQSRKAIPINCKNLNDILKLYSKMVNIPIKTLLERLDQVSGDFLQLDNFIETKDNKILWSAEEDEILRKGGVEVDLLRRYRGAGVEARKKYLGIN
jgi:hypothetical protein